jgi:hypothetical protein
MAMIESVASSRRHTKENARLQSLIPRQLQEDAEVLKDVLDSYYDFMNLFSYYYKEKEQTFYATVIDENLIFRTESNEYFYDEQLTETYLYDPEGNEVPIISIGTYVAGTDNLPEALADDLTTYGRLFFINTTNLGDYNFKQMRLVTPIIVYAGDSPSHSINNVLEQRDIDTIRSSYLEMIQKEIAASIPRSMQSDKKLLYKNIAQFYRERGSVESIKVFFRLLLNDEVEIKYPGEQMLIPSSGNYDPTSPNTLPVFDDDGNISGYQAGFGRYLDRKGFLSETDIRIQDSFFYQKFSYLIRTGSNLDTWGNAFNKLIHPAGFKFFGEIVLFIDLALQRNSIMPLSQPGLIGSEDLAILFEFFANATNPTFRTYIDENGSVTTVDILNKGYKYDVLPSVYFPEPELIGGVKAEAEVILDSKGYISSINITNIGSGYASPPALTIDSKVNRVAEVLPTIVMMFEASNSYLKNLSEDWKEKLHFFDNTTMYGYEDITFENIEDDNFLIRNNVGTEIYAYDADVTNKLQQPRL